jgi:hypothetical protein
MPSLRSGKERVIRVPTTRLRPSAPPRQPTPPIAPTVTNNAPIREATARIDSGVFVAPDFSVPIVVTSGLVLLAKSALNAEILGADSMRRSPPRPVEVPLSLPVFDIDHLNTEVVTFKDTTEALGRGNRSKKPTPKAPRKPGADPTVPQPDHQGKVTPKPKSLNQDFLEALIYRQKAPQREAADIMSSFGGGPLRTRIVGLIAPKARKFCLNLYIEAIPTPVT